MTPAPANLAENLARIRERIERAAHRAGRRAEEITLVAVSKTHPAERIAELYEAGARHFGESRVQEFESKSAALGNLDIIWHMIGHVQRNKAGRAVELFNTIDSVDTLALAEKLNGAVRKVAPLRVLLEVKLDPEPAKSGAEERDALHLSEAILRLPHLDLRGLMSVPPYSDNPEAARPFFSRLRRLRDALRQNIGAGTMSALSMGMSHDFEVAIEEGSTEIRVGTALFGEREEP